MVNPNHITPYAEIPETERELTDDLVFNRSDDALERFIEHFESKGEEAEQAAGDPTEGMEPEEALHWQILHRKKEGVEDWIDKSVEKIGAVPTLNTVLLPAMKEVGDKFGAGELILPFVLQSAEVMKRAVARLENYLERIEGHSKGKVVIATVFGDVHDIGKSLVNTILTNNGYTVVDLGKQVPIDTIVNSAIEEKADAIGLSALLVSTSKQMPAAVQELHAKKLDFPVLIGGAAINRDFGRRILYPGGKESDEIYEPGVFYCKDAFVGLDTMDELVEPERREALVLRIRDEAKALREKGEKPDDGPPTTDDSVRSAIRTDAPFPILRSGARARSTSTSTTSTPILDRHVLFKLHWGGRGKKGEEWRQIVEGHDGDEGFAPKLERMWREQDYLNPRAKLGYFPAAADGNEFVVFDPDDPERELERLVFPRQPKHDRICLADYFRPIDAQRRQRDVVALQGVTVGPEVTDLMARLEADGEFAEQLFTHGLGVQTAEGLAEWLHHEARSGLGIPAAQGRRYSWGYPACPDQSEHEKVWRLLGLEDIGMTLSDAYAVLPEQSTVAIVAHHPQADLLRHEVRLRARGSLPRRADRRHRARRRTLPPEEDPQRIPPTPSRSRRRRSPSAMERIVEREPTLAGSRTRAIELEGSGPPLILLHGFARQRRRMAGGDGPAARSRAGPRVALDMPGFGTADPLEAEAPILPQLDEFIGAATEALGRGVRRRPRGRHRRQLAGRHRRAPGGGARRGGPRGRRRADRARRARPCRLVRGDRGRPAGQGDDELAGPGARERRCAARSAAPSRSSRSTRPSAVDAGGDRRLHHALRLAARRGPSARDGQRLLPELEAPFDLSKVRCPVLLVWGERDRMVAASGAEQVLAEIPAARVELLQRCGHCPRSSSPTGSPSCSPSFPPAERPVSR